MKSDDSQSLALKAALLEPTDALHAWHALLARVAWMDFPDQVVRCLPSIAVNLGCHSRDPMDTSAEVPHSARLAGVYRSTWTNNIMRIRGLAPVFDTFDSQAIRYRVLKGAAVCAVTDRWGVRRMGDVDVAVYSDDAPHALRLLRRLGFIPRFYRVVHDDSPPAASCWVGPQNQILDVHVGNPSTRRPDVVDLLLDGAGVTALSQERQWALPSPEAMIVHAAAHARTAAAVSDRAQSLLDLARLLPLADQDALESLAHRSRVEETVSELHVELARLTESPLPRDRPPRPFRVGRLAESADRVVGEVRRLPRVRAERVLRPNAERAPLQYKGRLRTRLYRAWLATGQLRPVERMICAMFGGFLMEGAVDIPRDRRVRVPIPAPLRGGAIHVSVACQDPYARLLFIDGLSHGVIDQAASVRLMIAPESIEVSMRLLGDPPANAMGAVSIDVTSAHASVGHEQWT